MSTIHILHRKSLYLCILIAFKHHNNYLSQYYFIKCMCLLCFLQLKVLTNYCTPIHTCMMRGDSEEADTEIGSLLIQQ